MAAHDMDQGNMRDARTNLQTAKMEMAQVHQELASGLVIRLK
jgi:hypothetical protein